MLRFRGDALKRLTLIGLLISATAAIVSGCAVTDPNRTGDATVNNPLNCQSRDGHYQQDENGVMTCQEAPVHNRDETAQFLSPRAKTALYSAGLLALLNQLFHDKDDNNNCGFGNINCPWSE